MARATDRRGSDPLGRKECAAGAGDRRRDAPRPAHPSGSPVAGTRSGQCETVPDDDRTAARARSVLRRRWTVAAFALALALAAALPAAAGAAVPAWTTYHHDAERTGADPDGTSPLPPSLSWHSPDLGAPIWGQPLILGARVYVTTVGDGVYALDAATGQVVWHAGAGTPVPSKSLPCGDITPTVGIVGTPVIDRAAGILYAVADTWNGSQAKHVLEGFRISDGAQVLSTAVDPPGADPKAILQRTALNLDGANVVFGFGGNDGDCSVYRGAVVSVPESGAALSYWQVPINTSQSMGGGAIWATGGPAVNAAGQIFASTGNPNPRPGGKATEFDESDAVVSLSSGLGLTGAFEPPSWEADSNSDTDLGSAAPELLPGGLLFQAGKNGIGYLIDQATTAGVYSHQVCGGARSFGGDSYAAGVIYVPCTNGTQALAYNAAARTFTALWQGPSDANGPPIVSAGLVWTVATAGGGGTKLYGLDPATGRARYTETLPSPVIDHFASPSAAGGRLFLATGSTVTAYQTAVLTSVEASPGAPSAPAAGPGPAGGVAPPGLRAVLLLVRRSLHAGARGVVRLLLGCPASLTCRGTVTMSAELRVPGGSRHAHARVIHIRIARAAFGPRHGRFVLLVHLGRTGRGLLRRHHGRLRVTLTLALTGSSTQVGAVLSG
jgi:polyvinyl alcohol dehydrogenase (cytochrome)